MNGQRTILVGVYAFIVIFSVAILVLAAKIGKTQNYSAQPLGSRTFEQQ